MILLKGSRIIEIVAENLLSEGSVTLTVKATGISPVKFVQNASCIAVKPLANVKKSKLGPTIHTRKQQD